MTKHALRLVFVLWPAVVLVASPTRPIDPDNPPRGVFADDWYAVTLRGKKAGHMRSRLERKLDRQLKTDVIEAETTMKLTLGRVGQSIAVGTTERSTETLDGRIVRFSSVTDMSLMSTRIVGRVEGDKVVVTSTQLGQSVTNTYPLPPGALMTWGLYREQVKRRLTPGTSFTLPTYTPSLAADRVTPTRIEVVGPETIDLYGRVVQALKTRQVMQVKTPLGSMDVVSTAWLDEQQKPLKLETEMLRQSICLLQCDKAIALQPSDPVELMEESLIPATMPAGAAEAKSVTYRIRPRPGGGKRPARLPEIPRTAMQSVRRERDGSLLVTVVPGGCDDFNRAAPQPTKADLDAMRAPSAFTNTGDPRIQELARKAAGDEKDPLRLARRLRAFVSDYIETKDLGVGFATATEVAVSRQGDCSEHAVLLAALARACGLPARGVSGVAHASSFEGKRDVFVWHMWTQIYIDGRWVDIDAALHQDVPDATHIALGIVPLGDAGIGDMAFPILNLIGEIAIDVENVEEAPKAQ